MSSLHRIVIPLSYALFLSLLDRSALSVRWIPTHRTIPGSLSTRSPFPPRGRSAPTSSTSVEGEIERRWEALMRYCRGCWSGGIGWYDVDAEERKLTPRPVNGRLNMRMRFKPRRDDPDTADWVVYHASGKGVREDVVLKKHSDGGGSGGAAGSSPNLFYCFANGIIGRCGRDFAVFPFIEHGFWDDVEGRAGMRRTTVLAYDESGGLARICFLKQRRLPRVAAFDVSDHRPNDACVLRNRPKLSLDELRQSWRSAVSGGGGGGGEAEMISARGRREWHAPAPGRSALDRLLGSWARREGQCTKRLYTEDDGEILRVALPNGVLVACPWTLEGRKNVEISMGYKRKSGQVQIVEFGLFDMKLRNVKACWSK